MADFPDIAIPDQFADGVQVNAAALDAYITHQLNKLVARLTDTGWTQFTFNPGATNWEPAQTGLILTPPQWRQIGSWVVINGVVERTVDTAPSVNWNGANVFNVLPAAARPAAPWLQVCANTVTNGSQTEMKIDTDGGVQFRNTGSANFPAGEHIFISTAFPAG